MVPYNFKDLTGKKYGRWEVLHRVPHEGYNVYWRCRCQCGNEAEVAGMTLKNGRSTQCRRCWETGHKHNFNARVWGRILRNARIRDIAVDLGGIREAKAFLYELLYTKQNNRCALSGLPISISNTIKGDMHGETTASLDRIDSNKAYTRDNVQWVHKSVNRMKGDLEQSNFIVLCKAIASHSGV